MSKDNFRECGLKMGPAMKLAKEANALKTMPKHPFSSYHSLKEVLAKYDLNNGMTSILQFKP
ncbi:15871_t:CDS:1, partial [Acaulospora colombiana]